MTKLGSAPAQTEFDAGSLRDDSNSNSFFLFSSSSTLSASPRALPLLFFFCVLRAFVPLCLVPCPAAATAAAHPSGEPMTTEIRLAEIAHARSGDKGNHANIGVIAYTPAGFAFLERFLTAERVAEYFASLEHTGVERYRLPKIGALNFVLRDALGGGASRSLRIDTQGKLLSTALLDMPLAAPAEFEAMRRTLETRPADD